MFCPLGIERNWEQTVRRSVAIFLDGYLLPLYLETTLNYWYGMLLQFGLGRGLFQEKI